LADGTLVKSCVAYLTKNKILPTLQLASPRQCTRGASYFIQIGSLLVEL